MTNKTVSFVNLTEVLDEIGFNSEDVEYIQDFGFSNVSWGDAEYTLIGNNFALECILSALPHLIDDSDEYIPSRSIITQEDVVTKYWELVGQDDYVNLEGNG